MQAILGNLLQILEPRTGFTLYEIMFDFVSFSQRGDRLKKQIMKDYVKNSLHQQTCEAQELKARQLELQVYYCSLDN